MLPASPLGVHTSKGRESPPEAFAHILRSAPYLRPRRSPREATNRCPSATQVRYEGENKPQFGHKRKVDTTWRRGWQTYQGCRRVIPRGCPYLERFFQILGGHGDNTFRAHTDGNVIEQRLSKLFLDGLNVALIQIGSQKAHPTVDIKANAPWSRESTAM